MRCFQSVVGQVLNRDVVQSQLPLLAEAAAKVAADGSLADEFAHLSRSELAEAAKELEARVDGLISTAPQAHESASRRAAVPPVDDYAFIPRDHVASIVQSELEEALRVDKRVQQVTGTVDGRRGGEGEPPVTDEFVDGETALPASAGADERRLFGRFEIPSDPRWLSCKIAEGIRLFKHKHPFVDRPAVRKLGNRATLLLVGDWGTGLPRARKVSNAMRAVLETALSEGREVHVIHLGDVYYSGFDYEYSKRMLPFWPVWPEEHGQIGSWSLIGNHDMYAGGWGFWRVLLKDARFAGHDGSSHFQLENDYWRIFGLDTGYEEEHGSLPGKQLDWLERELTDTGPAEDGKRKRNLLLSHHQLLSAYEDPSAKLRERMLPLLAKHPIDGWFWGHEHRCMGFSADNGVGYGCCLGHGGVPVYQFHDPSDPLPAPGAWEYRAVLPGLLGLEPWGMFGFAVVELDDRQASARYINEVGFTHRPAEELPE